MPLTLAAVTKLHSARPPEEFLWPRAVISPLSDRIAAIDCEGAAIRLWDATKGAAVGVIRGDEGHVLVLGYSPDGKRLASGTAHRTIRLWDSDGAKPVAVLRGHERPVEWLAYGPSGRSAVINPVAARPPAVGDVRAGHERSRIPGASLALSSVHSQ